jgi:hypothetical protein
MKRSTGYTIYMTVPWEPGRLYVTHCGRSGPSMSGEEMVECLRRSGELMYPWTKYWDSCEAKLEVVPDDIR